MNGPLRPTAPLAPAALVAEWRDRGRLTDARLGWALDQAARARPDAPAVVDGQRRWTFAELRDRSDAIAHQLLDAGVGPGDVVAFALPNEVATVAVAAAIWRIGAVANPLVTLYGAHELAFAFAQLRPAAVITSPDVRGRDLCAEADEALVRAGARPARIATGPAPPGWRALAGEDGADGPPLPPEVVPAPADVPCLVLYTSGTTAEPKGVMHTAAGLLQEVGSMQRAWGLTFRDTMLMASPLTHITGLLQGLLVPCLVGARAVLMDRWDAEACVATIEREGATYMAGATPFLRGIVDAAARRPPGAPPLPLRQYCCGGAAVPPALIREADALGIAAYRCWGMTELPTATLAGERDPLELRATTDGRVAEAVEVEAVDDQRRPLPAGAEGELRLRGPERMVGYVDAALNADALDAEGWLYSGDVGVVDGDGRVRVTGRIKDVINRGGEKLSAREIEELLLRHPAISDAAVVGLPDARLGEQVCAVVVGRDSAHVDDETLRGFLREQRIAVQKLPARIEWAPELPRTASGKVRKHEIIESLTGRG